MRADPSRPLAHPGGGPRRRRRDRRGVLQYSPAPLSPRLSRPR